LKKQISLRWKIGRYLLFFGVMVIALLFVFQVVLLEPMYERYKLNMVYSVSDEIVASLDSEDLEDIIEMNQVKNDTCIRVFTSNTSSTSVSGGSRQGCRLYHMMPHQLNEMLMYALASEDGTYLSIEDSSDTFFNPDEKFKNVTYTRVIDEEDETNVVMVYTGIAEVNPATQTIKTQLIFIGIILILMIICLTLVLYRQIAHPLILINQSAKTLPEGVYKGDEKTNRYLEAQELNATLTQAAEDIRKADKAKRDLIANVSHDLRTPLTMIGGYGEMMIDLPEEKTDENIQVIIDEAKRLTNLVNDLLDLSKLQENKIELHENVFDLAALVRAQLQKYEVYRLKEGFEIEAELVGSALIKGDSIRIGQVFNNFMTNAINYSGESKRIVVRQEIEGDCVKTSVRDFGEGIAQADLPDIWDRYYKVDKEHVRVSSGSGIGLSIVKEILDLHHAKYGVESELSKGSTFWFSFPLHHEEEAK